MSYYCRRAEELRRRGRQRADHARYRAGKLDRRALLRRAWGVARAGAARFGGRARVYLAAALRQAWTEVKARIAVARGMAEDRYALTVTGLLALRAAEAASATALSPRDESGPAGAGARPARLPGRSGGEPPAALPPQHRETILMPKTDRVSGTSRRTLLADGLGLPALGAALVAPATLLPAIAAPAGPEPDPHPAWAAGAAALFDRARALPVHEEELWEELIDRGNALMDRVAETPARTLAGVREQLRFAVSCIAPSDDAGYAEDETVRNALATIETLLAAEGPGRG